MTKYLKYFVSPATIIITIIVCSLDSYAPTIFFVGFSSFIILGDIYFGENLVRDKYKYPSVLNISLYLNLPLLLLLILSVIFIFSKHHPSWLINIINPDYYHYFFQLYNIINSYSYKADPFE